MSKYICVHGHFYQPPRENAWLEKIEYQDSAAPYHDWNERITRECYGPNGVSRIMSDDGRIVDIVNNYSRMSFNFGPTLLSWMEQNSPKTYHRILEADQRSMKRFGGHGSAMAQVYNHIIMPLANRRDKETQVIWGLRDFEKRFGRKADGMWLAETAVDTETLEVLAEQGLKFTVLAPRQAKRYKRIIDGNWTDGVDPKIPYLLKLPSGKTIHLFFYDGERSQAVAFKGLLKDGKEFANYLVDGFDNRKENQLMHIATDGESYGHHHRNGDMALAYCIRYIEDNNLATVTNYAQYLEMNPPEHEVEIHDNSSWSCVHGVERWRSDCGCNSGGRPGWDQQWRAPLRNSLDWLRGNLEKIFEREISTFDVDPWEVRNAYIDVILERNSKTVNKFLRTHFGSLSAERRTHVMRILEMQRQEMLMYTSCGWFFDEISGIETVQILQYACRAIQLAESETDASLEGEFLERLSKAPSNFSGFENGADVFQSYVLPSQLTLTQIGMHFAVASLYAENPDEIVVFNYGAKSSAFKRIVQGNQRLVLGRTHVNSKVTLSDKEFSFVVLYLGQHHLIGKAFSGIPLEEYNGFADRVIRAFQDSNLSEVLEQFKTYPEQRSFSFFDMFKDEQIKLLNGILEYGVELAASSYKKINDRNYNLLNVMRAKHLDPPKILVKNLEMVVNNDLAKLFSNGNSRIDIPELVRVVEEVEKWDFLLDSAQLDFTCSKKLDSMLADIGDFSNGNGEGAKQLVVNIHQALKLLARVGVYPELNDIQNTVFRQIMRLPNNVQGDTRKELYDFAAYINLDVSKIPRQKVTA
ncbi:MAG: DUF3536 domain-containing protein [Cryomorphaceae bacterium]|nr:DUF3536 domain-containing protein [Flavobacteriales bacterium]